MGGGTLQIHCRFRSKGRSTQNGVLGIFIMRNEGQKISKESKEEEGQKISKESNALIGEEFNDR